MTEHTIEIHTGDRGTFKRCRRKFGWLSPLRRNLVLDGQPEGDATWIGSGFHWAMEDYFGHKRFADPVDAFYAYKAAGAESEAPDNVEDDTELAVGMIDYYVNDWLGRHPEPYDTLWIDGVPQVEVEVAIDITDLLPQYVQARAAIWCRLEHSSEVDSIAPHRVVYVTTFDRVVIDKHERIWGIDYKTAKSFDAGGLAMNPQAEAYDWAMSVYYGERCEGIIWQQHLKAVPAPPELIKKGTALSQDKRQYTSHSVYRAAVIEMFGTVPQEYVEMLNFLAEGESVEGDRFIRRDPIHKNEAQRRAAQAKIVLEVTDMLDPGLAMYPNPTRDCSWDCPFKAPCMMMDDGSDVEAYLASEYTQWQGYKDDWRERIKYPRGAKNATR